MAALGVSAAGSNESRRRDLTCPVCLRIFTDPKFLCCHHSFCSKCIENLSLQNSQVVTCPMCRRRTMIPLGGWKKLQNNFYLQAEELERARADTKCLTHSEEKMDLYCIECQMAVCKLCTESNHKEHSTKNLQEEVSETRVRLQKDIVRLQTAVEFMTADLQTAREERREIREKKDALEMAIHKKHDMIVAIADEFREELLDSLNKVNTDIVCKIDNDLNLRQDNLEKLCIMKRMAEEAIRGESSGTLLRVAKEISEGRGSSEAVGNLTSKRSSVCRPVQYFKSTLGAIRNNIKDFFGVVDRVELQVAKPEVKTVEQFDLKSKESVEIYSVCPMGDGKFVWLSYEWYGVDDNKQCEKFEENGTQCLKSTQARGRVTFKSRASGEGLFLHDTKRSRVNYSKSQTDTFLYLVNNLQGTACVKRLQIISENPMDIDTNTEFKINVGEHRTFDIDSSQQLFAVIAEGQTSNNQRKIHLYHRNKEDAVATYSPPTASCQPTDVCFYRLGGREVLIVSDEGTDSLHVVEIEDGVMCFKRYLDPGCSLLVQPTALNTDTTGRLWVACRGGTILTMTPIS